MSHYEMPLNLAIKYDGWTNRKLIDFFENYARVLFNRYKDKVPCLILFLHKLFLLSYNKAPFKKEVIHNLPDTIY